ncbi:hypothetical protein [Moorena sp. SIO4G3]|nr:hypothetical protein [Moorena sp. SIO4G3]NEO75887.1 hypothetical protein [Moorena sp. SIO4G3]
MRYRYFFYLLPIPCSLFPVPCSLLPTPYSLLPNPFAIIIIYPDIAE